MHHKEYKIVLAIVAVVFVIAFISSNRHSDLELTYSKYEGNFSQDDFSINMSKGCLKIGSSTCEDVVNLIPDGHTLGMSTIYQPDNIDCLLTFTKKDNILSKIHIESPELATSRGAKVGDPFARITDLYGTNYSSVKLAGKTGDFDAIYGNDNNKCIVFQVRNDYVKKIILVNEANK